MAVVKRAFNPPHSDFLAPLTSPAHTHTLFFGRKFISANFMHDLDKFFWQPIRWLIFKRDL